MILFVLFRISIWIWCLMLIQIGFLPPPLIFWRGCTCTPCRVVTPPVRNTRDTWSSQCSCLVEPLLVCTSRGRGSMWPGWVYRVYWGWLQKMFTSLFCFLVWSAPGVQIIWSNSGCRLHTSAALQLQLLSLICLSTNQNIQLIHSLLIRIELTTDRKWNFNVISTLAHL